MSDNDVESPGAEVPSAEVARVGDSGRAPWLRFALIFGALAVASEIAYYGIILESELFRSYLRVLASTSAFLLSLFAEGITVHGAQLSGMGFAVEVAHGCDAIQVCALLVSAVIAFPAPLWHKLKGILAGVVILQVLNLLRIMSLFVIGATWSPTG